jgi:AraC-like DNA-binding protein
MHHPRGLVEVAMSQGADRERLLAGTGISDAMLRNPEARVTTECFGRLIDNALRETGNPALGLDLGRHLHLANLGMLGLAVMNSHDVPSTLELGLTYYRSVAPAWEILLDASDDVGLFTAREVLPLGRHRVFATEALLASIAGMARTLVGVELPLLEVSLPYPRPAHADRYREFTRAPIRFDEPAVRVAFDGTVLRRPLPSPDPISMRMAERQCAALMASTSQSDGLIAQVRRLLGSKPGEYLDLTELAGVLQTSARSLRRNLQRTGTSYQTLLDEVRCDHANECLLGTDMTMECIAEHLGFSDVRSFRRAFKRWTSETPAEYRRIRRAAAPAESTPAPAMHVPSAYEPAAIPAE